MTSYRYTSTTYAYDTTVEDDPDNTETVTLTDNWGNPLSRTKTDLTTGVVLSQDNYNYKDGGGNYYDPLRRGHDVTDLAGRKTQYRYNDYDCCGYSTITDPDGSKTQFNYDLLKHQVASTVFYGGVDGIMTTNVLDANGRVLQTQRMGTDNSVITLSQSQYDVLGRVVAQTNALGGVTTTAYGVVNNQLYVTNTYPDGGVRVDTYYVDGRLQSVTGTAVHPVEYLYGAEPDTDGTWRQYTQEIKLTPTGGTNEWTKTYVDGAGRNYKTIYSAANQSYPCSQSYYNEYGQRWKQVDPDGVTTLYIYNNSQNNFNQGRVQYTITALSTTARGLATYDSLVSSLPTLQGGIDRIQCVTNSVVPAASGKSNLIRTDTSVWQDGQSTGTLLSRYEVSTNGLNTWQTLYRDASTAVTTSSQTIPGASRVVTAIAPDNSYTISTYSYGRLNSSTRYDSTGAQIGGTTYGYDAHGRQNTMTDARNGTTTLGYNNADLVATNTTPNPGGSGASPQITTTLYDTMLRPYSVIQPDGTTVNSVYLFTGELGLQYGSRTYPVGYSYDYAGRLQTMTNWSGFNTLAGARVTTWNYDPYRGFLAGKTYDGNTAGPSYTYTSAGRLLTRAWARGITTTYSYDNGGGLYTVSYSDSTPGVTYAYDRLGRQSAIACNGMTDTLSYNLVNQLLSESYSGGILAGLIVTNNYDTDFRRTNLSILDSPSSILARTAYGYDAASRLATVSDGNYNTATYGYLANSPLVSQIAFTQSGTTRMTTSKTYDYLNRLTQISSVGGASSASPQTFNYNYNPANQRTKDTLADGSYWVYQYDSLGQVTNGVKYFRDNTLVPGQQFGYTFDTIGNRTQTKSGGDAAGSSLRLANYSANNLNQITQRDYPGTNDVVGVALATNAVTVNTKTAWRKGEYFQATVVSNNTAAAQWEGISVAGGSFNSTGSLYVPKTPEQFSYDADGNLTNDGRWAYIWDAENRLTNMTSLASAPAGSKLKLDFIYDAKGRRIQKIVSTNNGSIYVPQYTNRFVYDDWNLIAILNPQSSILASFTWGNDLSGSLQGAGGVGGLLLVTCHSSPVTNCFATYDGNGNVAALVNAADGTTLANYEYGPFGEVIRASGPMAKVNPFRFSTKYCDDETDLVYYGYRYYNPSTGRWLSKDPLSEQAFLRAYLNGKSKQEQRSLQHQALLPPYLFVSNDPISDWDVLGLIDCTKAPPLLDTCPDCNKYGNGMYLGSSLKCFCKCAGNSKWAQQVRACLACEFQQGTDISTAHHKCYAAAGGVMNGPVGTLAYCWLECFGPPDAPAPTYPNPL